MEVSMKIISVFGFLVILFTNVLIASPGDSVGITGYEYQRKGSFGQRLYVGDSHQVHICWTKVPFPYSSLSQKRIEWNFRDTDGSYFGEVDATPFTSGYGSLDMTRDLNIQNQRTVICFHFNTGSNAYFPFYDIDAGNGFGAFPNDPKNPPNSNLMLYPCVARVNNGNTILATGDLNLPCLLHHIFATTDDGNTWLTPIHIDSAYAMDQFVRSSNNPGSNKVVFTNTKYRSDSMPQMEYDLDVRYMISTDGGVTWGPQVNLTHYQPSDSIRSYLGINTVFDLNDKLHIVWGGRHVSAGIYYDASKIFHWDEVSNTVSVVSGSNPYFPGGWWGWRTDGHQYGILRMPCDEPQLVVDRTTGWLYCLWHGQDDTTDISQLGYTNKDLYGSFSTDGGLTWGAYGSANGYVNLTNTHTPGAPPGQCENEDFMTANPFTVGDSIFITYIEDKDGGTKAYSEGDTTDNPVRMWVFHKSLITGVPAVEEVKATKPSVISLNIYPNPFRKTTSLRIGLSAESRGLKIYDINGRLVKSFSLPYAFGSTPFTVIWQGDDLNGNALSVGVYICRFADGKRILTRKIIKLE
jgi:hypothetical protein